MSDHNNHNESMENSNLGDAEEDQQLSSSDQANENEQDDNPLTHADTGAETSEANEASAAKNAVYSGSHDSALKYIDRNRSTSTRANEATSGTDTNTCGLGAGGGNSAGEIM